MAINVDTVYKTVLLILNNEQRGYMTPDEFNKIGSQVQRQIFEAYFEDLNQQLRIPQSDMEYSDRVAITDEKIAEFKTELNPTGTNPFTVPDNLYRLGSITYEPNASTYKEIQRVGRAEIYNIRKAPLTAPTTNYPIYLYEDNKALVYPETIIDPLHIKMQYVKKPSEIRWGYYIGGLGQYINDPTTYGDLLLNNGSTLSNIILNPTGITLNQTYTGLTTTVSPSGGTGAILSVTVSAGTVTSVEITSPGSGYNIGDTLIVSSSQFVGAPTSDLEIQLTESDFNSGSTYGSTNFELHNSERTEVILRILLYSGIVIRDPSIIQVAAQKIQQEEVNEKS
jgi:hypothetical protein